MPIYKRVYINILAVTIGISIGCIIAFGAVTSFRVVQKFLETSN